MPKKGGERISVKKLLEEIVSIVDRNYDLDEKAIQTHQSGTNGSGQPIYNINIAYNNTQGNTRSRPKRKKSSNGNGSNGNRVTVKQLHQEFNEYRAQMDQNRTQLNQRLDQIAQGISNPQNPQPQPPQSLNDQFLRWLGNNIVDKDARIEGLDGRVNELVNTVRELYKNRSQGQPAQDGQQGDYQRGRDGRGDEAQTPRDGQGGDNQQRDRAQDGDYQRGRDGRGDEAQTPRGGQGDRPEGYDRQGNNGGDQEDDQPARDEPREEQPQGDEDIGEPPQEEQPAQEDDEEPEEEPEQERSGVIKAYFELKKQVENEITGMELDVMQCYVLAARAALKVEGDIRQIDLDKLEEKVTEGKYLLSLYKNLSERARKTMFVSAFKDETHQDDVIYGRYGFGLPSLEVTVAEKKSRIKYDDIWKLCANRVKSKRALPGTKIREEDTGKVLPYVGLKSGRETLKKGVLLDLLNVHESQGKILPEQVKTLNEGQGTKLSYAA